MHIGRRGIPAFLKNLSWMAVKSATKVDFNEPLNEIKVISIQAHDDFMATGVEKFPRSSISLADIIHLAINDAISA